MNRLPRQLTVDFRSGVPIYVQIMEQISQMIAANELKPGDQLPTVRELATELKVNWNTIARSYRMLDEARLISTQRGRGTYVWEKPTPEAVAKIRQQSLEGLTRHYLEEAARRGFSAEEVADMVGAMLVDWQDNVAPLPEEGSD